MRAASSGHVSPPEGEHHVRLADGRTLTYCEYGAAGGAPVFFCHGWPGSRLDFAANGAAAETAGARVIAVGAHYYPGDGHLIFFSRIEEILTELVAD